MNIYLSWGIYVAIPVIVAQHVAHPLVAVEVIGSNLVITKDVKNDSY